MDIRDISESSSSSDLGDKPSSPRASYNETRLYLRVIECKNISSKPKNFFVSVLLDGKETWRSSITKKSFEWNETGRFIPVNEDIENVKISLYEKGIMNEKKGSVNLSILNLDCLYPYNRWFPIEHKKKFKGELHLQLMLLPPNVKITTDIFDTPLHYLILKDKYQLFENCLQEDFTNLETYDREGRTALHFAVERNELRYVQLLLKKLKTRAAKLNDNQLRRNALHTACVSKSSIEIVKLLLESNFDVNEGDIEEQTPLHLACITDHHDIIDLLVESGSKVSIADNKRNTPLAYALMNQSINSISKILKHKPNLYKKNEVGLSVWEISQRRDLVNMEARKVFMSTLGVDDGREFLHRVDFPKKIVKKGKCISTDYLKSTQFSISVEKKEDIVIMVSSSDPLISNEFSEKSGFVLVKSDQGIHNEPDFSRDAIAFGGSKPVKVLLDPNFYYNVIPFSKYKQNEGKFDLIIQTRKNSTCKVSQLKPWKYCVELEGSWHKKSAGGAQPNPSWMNNPQFEVSFPKEDDFEFTVYLSQEKNDPKLRSTDGGRNLTKLPYGYNIGFYILDRSGLKVIDQTDKWTNARGVHKYFKMNFSEKNHRSIMPCTMYPGEESPFTLKIFSDKPVSVKKK